MIENLSVGDKITLPFWTKRRWYQFWKPKWRKSVQTFTIISNTGGVTPPFAKTPADG